MFEKKKTNIRLFFLAPAVNVENLLGISKILPEKKKHTILQICNTSDADGKRPSDLTLILSKLRF